MTQAPEKSPQKRLRAIRDLIRIEQSQARLGVKADINVTPLVDVVLVLLIIFMVVTPLIASGVAVDLPRTLHHSRKPDDGKDIIVSVTHDKRIYVGASRVGRPEDIGRMVNLEKRKSPEKSVFVKGDGRVSYGVMRQVMQALHSSEIDDIVLGTEELSRDH